MQIIPWDEREVSTTEEDKEKFKFSFVERRRDAPSKGSVLKGNPNAIKWFYLCDNNKFN